MSTQKKIRSILGAMLLVAAIASVVMGIVTVNRHNAKITNYPERETLYDGPWLPIEFSCLFGGVTCIKWDEWKEEDRERGIR